MKRKRNPNQKTKENFDDELVDLDAIYECVSPPSEIATKLFKLTTNRIF
jgi:hypothetical protein